MNLTPLVQRNFLPNKFRGLTKSLGAYLIFPLAFCLALIQAFRGEIAVFPAITSGPYISSFPFRSTIGDRPGHFAPLCQVSEVNPIFVLSKAA
jgi:hypothetical protein